MNNKEDTASPIKLFHKVALEVKAYNCIVCGKRAGNENPRTPGQKGLATFVSALQIKGECNGFPKHAYINIFDFDKKSLNTGITDVRWHPLLTPPIYHILLLKVRALLKQVKKQQLAHRSR